MSFFTNRNQSLLCCQKISQYVARLIRVDVLNYNDIYQKFMSLYHESVTIKPWEWEFLSNVFTNRPGGLDWRIDGDVPLEIQKWTLRGTEFFENYIPYLGLFAKKKP